MVAPSLKTNPWPPSRSQPQAAALHESSPMFGHATGQPNRIACQHFAMLCACIAAVLGALGCTLDTGHEGEPLELDTGHLTLSLSLSDPHFTPTAPTHGPFLWKVPVPSHVPSLYLSLYIMRTCTTRKQQIFVCSIVYIICYRNMLSDCLGPRSNLQLHHLSSTKHASASKHKTYHVLSNKMAPWRT
jgi:hypothetical protein